MRVVRVFALKGLHIDEPMQNWIENLPSRSAPVFRISRPSMRTATHSHKFDPAQLTTILT